MATFKVKLKIEGFELEIEGEREDAALINEHIGAQFSNLLKPIDGIIEGTSTQEQSNQGMLDLGSAPASSTSPKRRPKKKKTTTSETEKSEEGAIDFRHSPEIYGYPKQSWNTATKAVWMIYVLREAANHSDPTSRTIAETFNKHFRQSGTITVGNVTRDLGKMKSSEQPSPLGEDTRRDPSSWFLTDTGNQKALQLIAVALGGESQS